MLRILRIVPLLCLTLAAFAEPSVELQRNYLVQGDQVLVKFAGAASVESATITVQSATGGIVWSEHVKLLGRDETVVPAWRTTEGISDSIYTCYIQAPGLSAGLPFLLVGELKKQAEQNYAELEKQIAEAEIELATEPWPGRFGASYREITRLLRIPMLNHIEEETSHEPINRFITLTEKARNITSEIGMRRRAPQIGIKKQLISGLATEGSNLYLQGKWALRTTPIEEENFSEIVDPKTIPEDWLGVELPCELHTALAEIGAINDPQESRNDRYVKWIGKRAWWFRKYFKFMPMPYIAEDRYELVVENALGKVDAWFNGTQLKRIRDNVFEVTPEVWGNRSIALVLRYVPDASKTGDTASHGIFKHIGGTASDEKDTREDPTLRPVFDRIGILGNVYLRPLRALQLNEIKSTILNPETDEPALSVDVSILNNTGSEIEGSLQLYNDSSGRRARTREDTTLAAGLNVLNITSTLENIAHWIPETATQTTAGGQHQLNFLVGRRRAINVSVNSGLRSVKTKKDNDGNSTVVIGGREFAVRGAKWYGISATGWNYPPSGEFNRLERFLDMAVNAHLNTLWVINGRLEPDAFYEACDRKGVMVWQSLKPETDAWRNLDVWVREVMTTVGSHPSVVAWETDPSLSEAKRQQLKDMLRQYDNVRLINEKPWIEIPDITPRTLLSESSMRAMIGAGKTWPPTPNWRFHAADEEMLAIASPINNEREAVARIQEIQAQRFTSYMEETEKEKPLLGGLMFGRFNDPWPCFSTSFVDYYGRPKRIYYDLKRACMPIRIVYRGEDPVQIWFENRTDEMQGGIITILHSRTDLLTHNTDRTQRWSTGTRIQLSPRSATKAVEVSLQELKEKSDFEMDRSFLISRFFQGQSAPGKFHYFVPREELFMPDKDRCAFVDRPTGDDKVHEIKIRSRGFADTVVFEDDHRNILFEDNYLDVSRNLSCEIRYHIGPTAPSFIPIKVTGRNIPPGTGVKRQ